ncbi:unnamed protein product [Haemonchus placei]|uniref:Conotoxin Superfamily SF1 n=2 Tax=Haemonchus TaxID=6288 RepID=A0A0N4WS70_HAEPC|nr:unnamed protein product [Haemonchus placei]
MTVWKSSFDMFSLFILLLFLPDSLDTHPLQNDFLDSSTRR